MEFLAILTIHKRGTRSQRRVNSDKVLNFYVFLFKLMIDNGDPNSTTNDDLTLNAVRGALCFFGGSRPALLRNPIAL